MPETEDHHVPLLGAQVFHKKLEDELKSNPTTQHTARAAKSVGFAKQTPLERPRRVPKKFSTRRRRKKTTMKLSTKVTANPSHQQKQCVKRLPFANKSKTKTSHPNKKRSKVYNLPPHVTWDGKNVPPVDSMTHFLDMIIWYVVQQEG